MCGRKLQAGGQSAKRPWEAYLKTLQDFIAAKGAGVEVTTADDRALYEWVLRQRETRRQGKMKEGRIAQLDALGFSWGAAAVGEAVGGGASAPADAPPPAPPAPAPPVDATVASLEAAGASGGVKMGGGAAAVAVAVVPVVTGVPVGASGAGEGAGARPSATDLAEARFDDQLKELVRPSHEPLEPFGLGN